MGDLLTDVVKDGVKVNIAIDYPSAITAGVVIFVALTLALIVYGKVIN
jgi:predicted peptidase